MKIAFDIDDTLVDFNSAFLRHYNGKYGTDFKIEEGYHYEHLGISREQNIIEMEEFFKSEDFKNMTLLPGVKESMAKIQGEHAIVTARPAYLLEITNFHQTKLETAFPVFFSFNNFSQTGDKSKSEICVKEGYDIIVEDNVKNAIECAEKGIKSILIVHPWTKTENLPESVIQVNNWEEILQILKKS
ncbi:MAG: hypothetical protein IIC67_12455 [Thaumarchaeota archaeon]|nr:hypothetical protein [Nitrososphaerota archaeon]